MRRFSKITLIICAVMGAVGLFLMVAGLALGFSTGELADAIEGRGIQVVRSGVYTVTDSSGGAAVEVATSFGPEEGIQSLELEVDAGRVYISTTTQDAIVIEGSVSSYFTAEVDSAGVLVIRNVRNGSRASRIRRRDIDIEISIPEDYLFERVQFAVGAGEFIAADMQMEELVVDVGAGTFAATGFQVSQDVWLDGGAGSMSLQGEISGNVSADCGVGSINMELTNEYEDFNYYIDCGIGQVIAGDEKYSGLGREVVRANGADQDMNLDCGIGEIRVEF